MKRRQELDHAVPEGHLWILNMLWLSSIHLSSLLGQRGESQRGQILCLLAGIWHLTWLGQLLLPALGFESQVAKDGKKVRLSVGGDGGCGA